MGKIPGRESILRIFLSLRVKRELRRSQRRGRGGHRWQKRGGQRAQDRCQGGVGWSGESLSFSGEKRQRGEKRFPEHGDGPDGRGQTEGRTATALPGSLFQYDRPEIQRGGGKVTLLGFPDAFLKTSEDADWDGSGERWEPFRAGDPVENARTGHGKVGDALPGLPPSSASQCNRHAPSFCCAAERAAPKAARGH